MSDDPIQAAEPAEIAQSAVEPSGSPAPWGDDFNPDRAWQTITHLRGREKELEQQAKEYERLRSDPEAQKQFLSELGYEFDEPEQDFEAEDPDDPTRQLSKQLSELQEWKSQQVQKAALEAFNKDVDGFAAQAKVELTEDDRILLLQKTIASGNDKAAAKRAFDAHVESVKAREKQIIDRYLKAKTDGVPSPPQAGKAGRAEFDPTDRNSRQARMAAVIAAEQQQ